jgi:transcriptional regulator with XRE-family HTH domain
MSRKPLLRTLVGEVLRRHRQAQKRTLADVARDASVSVQYLSEVERGRKEPSSEILAAVCESLGVDLSDLLAEVRHELVALRTPAPVLSPAPVLRLDAARRRRSPSSISAPVHHRNSGDVTLLAA